MIAWFAAAHEANRGWSAFTYKDPPHGMVSAQRDVAIGEAFVRLRAYAYAQDRRISDIARDIVARRLQLTPDGNFPGTVRDEALPAGYRRCGGC